MERWQLDPYAWTDEVTVLACAPADGRWRVRTTPTVLYPEGGGQPADHGSIGAVPVVDVQADADGVVHTTTAPVPLGPATVTVDAVRRFDHMQQHTGQHLLTALLLARYGIGTTSFHLGPEHVAIEVDAPRVDPEVLRRVEDDIDAVIREARPIRSLEVDPDELGPRGVRSRGLPAGFSVRSLSLAPPSGPDPEAANATPADPRCDFTGRVRLVDIDGIDLNTCGGTHLRHTGELQGCVILGAKPVGARGSRIHFLYGGRLRRRLHALLDHERALHRALSTGDHLAAIERLHADRRAMDRRLSAALDALVAHAAVSPGRVHRLPGADARALAVAAARCAEARPADTITLLAPGDEVLLAVVGPDAAAVGQRLLAACGGKGGGPNGRFQARLHRLPTEAELAPLA